MDALQAEPVRLVIWDLDETFWGGTLSEGGITYRRDIHDIVVTLARRGIVSSICSKNDLAPVRDVLQREGIWDYFVFPSINWEPKGQRLAALVDAVQLRPATVMFIDDNPMNLGEAQHYVPGLQTRSEHFIGEILDHPLFKGKDDHEMKRLAQYRLLQHRQAEEASFGSDNTEFLRASGLTVTIEHDLEPHIDRAVELINRTNQLNFTKLRLSEEPEQARAELRKLLAGYEVQAGLLRVQDRYGDYGYSGLYITKTGGGWKKILHFCFSCRILNMGVETWLYNRLGRPPLHVVGDVLTNVVKDKRDIDWITLQSAGMERAEGVRPPQIDVFYARGGCDLLAVSHYFGLSAKTVVGDYNFVRDGANLRLEHSMFARYALQGVDRAACDALLTFGFRVSDFAASLPAMAATPAGVWLLSFWADADYALYRHRKTGVMAPLSLPGVMTNMRNLIVNGDDFEEIDKAFLEELRNEFEFVGQIPETEFKTNVRLLLSAAPAGTSVFILQMNEKLPRQNKPGGVISQPRQQINRWAAEVAAEFASAILLNIVDFVENPSEQLSASHFDRMVYFRIYRHIMQVVGDGAAAEPAEALT